MTKKKRRILYGLALYECELKISACLPACKCCILSFLNFWKSYSENCEIYILFLFIVSLRVVQTARWPWTRASWRENCPYVV